MIWVSGCLPALLREVELLALLCCNGLFLGGGSLLRRSGADMGTGLYLASFYFPTFVLLPLTVRSTVVKNFGYNITEYFDYDLRSSRIN